MRALVITMFAGFLLTYGLMSREDETYSGPVVLNRHPLPSSNEAYSRAFRDGWYPPAHTAHSDAAPVANDAPWMPAAEIHLEEEAKSRRVINEDIVRMKAAGIGLGN